MNLFFLALVDRPIIWQGLDATLIVNALVIGIKDFAQGGAVAQATIIHSLRISGCMTAMPPKRHFFFTVSVLLNYRW